MHLHLTDRLLGDPDELLRVVAGLVRRCRLSVTLHDVPQPTDGLAAFQRRRAVYQAVVAQAAGWVTSSEHERDLVARWCRPTTAGAVIPLPVRPAPPVPPSARVVEAGTVGVFGFYYPGKGHRPVLDALGLLRRRGVGARLVVLGGPAPGHDGDLAALAARADHLGVPLEVTGHLPEAEVLPALRAVAVPVLGHRNVSASGSLNSWLAAGRRPLVRVGTYTREMGRLRPGTTTPFESGRLVAPLAAALADPGRTWLDQGTDLRPGPRETVAAYRAWWADLAGHLGDVDDLGDRAADDGVPA
ncbi:hypothetical protein [Nocardioides aequoreus]|uniref:hypothetical protein n=1 Tax=Nocardioides aequoreus TaxID=397278 RepID=UPI00068F7379|nr:hypothetical protein [Nocardioides aequoreus]